jgi:hypothetical protein
MSSSIQGGASFESRCSIVKFDRSADPDMSLAGIEEDGVVEEDGVEARPPTPAIIPTRDASANLRALSAAAAAASAGAMAAVGLRVVGDRASSKTAGMGASLPSALGPSPSTSDAQPFSGGNSEGAELALPKTGRSPAAVATPAQSLVSAFVQPPLLEAPQPQSAEAPNPPSRHTLLRARDRNSKEFATLAGRIEAEGSPLGESDLALHQGKHISAQRSEMEGKALATEWLAAQPIVLGTQEPLVGSGKSIEKQEGLVFKSTEGEDSTPRTLAVGAALGGGQRAADPGEEKLPRQLSAGSLKIAQQGDIASALMQAEIERAKREVEVIRAALAQAEGTKGKGSKSSALNKGLTSGKRVEGSASGEGGLPENERGQDKGLGKRTGQVIGEDRAASTEGTREAKDEGQMQSGSIVATGNEALERNEEGAAALGKVAPHSKRVSFGEVETRPFEKSPERGLEAWSGGEDGQRQAGSSRAYSLSEGFGVPQPSSRRRGLSFSNESLDEQAKRDSLTLLTDAWNLEKASAWEPSTSSDDEETGPVSVSKVEGGGDERQLVERSNVPGRRELSAGVAGGLVGGLAGDVVEPGQMITEAAGASIEPVSDQSVLADRVEVPAVEPVAEKEVSSREVQAKAAAPISSPAIIVPPTWAALLATADSDGSKSFKKAVAVGKEGTQLTGPVSGQQMQSVGNRGIDKKHDELGAAADKEVGGRSLPEGEGGEARERPEVLAAQRGESVGEQIMGSAVEGGVQAGGKEETVSTVPILAPSGAEQHLATSRERGAALAASEEERREGSELGGSGLAEEGSILRTGTGVDQESSAGSADRAGASADAQTVRHSPPTTQESESDGVEIPAVVERGSGSSESGLAASAQEGAIMTKERGLGVVGPAITVGAASEKERDVEQLGSREKRTERPIDSEAAGKVVLAGGVPLAAGGAEKEGQMEGAEGEGAEGKEREATQESEQEGEDAAPLGWPLNLRLREGRALAVSPAVSNRLGVLAGAETSEGPAVERPVEPFVAGNGERLVESAVTTSDGVKDGPLVEPSGKPSGDALTLGQTPGELSALPPAQLIAETGAEEDGISVPLLAGEDPRLGESPASDLKQMPAEGVEQEGVSSTVGKSIPLEDLVGMELEIVGTAPPNVGDEVTPSGGATTALGGKSDVQGEGAPVVEGPAVGGIAGLPLVGEAAVLETGPEDPEGRREEDRGQVSAGGGVGPFQTALLAAPIAAGLTTSKALHAPSEGPVVRAKEANELQNRAPSSTAAVGGPAELSQDSGRSSGMVTKSPKARHKKKKLKAVSFETAGSGPTDSSEPQRIEPTFGATGPPQTEGLTISKLETSKLPTTTSFAPLTPVTATRTSKDPQSPQESLSVTSRALEVPSEGPSPVSLEEARKAWVAGVSTPPAHNPTKARRARSRKESPGGPRIGSAIKKESSSRDAREVSEEEAALSSRVGAGSPVREPKGLPKRQPGGR